MLPFSNKLYKCANRIPKSLMETYCSYIDLLFSGQSPVEDFSWNLDEYLRQRTYVSCGHLPRCIEGEDAKMDFNWNLMIITISLYLLHPPSNSLFNPLITTLFFSPLNEIKPSNWLIWSCFFSHFTLKMLFKSRKIERQRERRKGQSNDGSVKKR